MYLRRRSGRKGKERTTKKERKMNQVTVYTKNSFFFFFPVKKSRRIKCHKLPRIIS